MMGAFEKAITPKVAHGDPIQTGKNILMWGDSFRSFVIDFLPIQFGVAILYDKAMIQGESNRSWGLGDTILVIVVSWFLRTVGMKRRWM